MPVTPHFAIIVDLDKVPDGHAAWTGAGCTAFALTISAGLVKDYQALDTTVNPPKIVPPPPQVLPAATRWADVSKWFLPWNWFPKAAADSRRRPPFVRLWRKLAAGGDFTLLDDGAGNTLWPVRDLYDGAVSPLQADDPGLKQDSKQARDFHDTTWKERARPKDADDWNLADEEKITWRTPVSSPVDPGLYDETNQFRLTSQIAKAATSCFPQNHANGLACCVVVKLDPATIVDGDSFMALPVWSDAWGAPDSVLSDPGDANGDASIEKRGLYSSPDAGWVGPKDTAGNALPVFGYSRVWKFKTPDPSAVSFLDLGKMVVSLKGGWHDDWLSRLENETAALFDLSQRLVDAARACLKAKIHPPAKPIAQWIVLASRELAGFGLLQAADGTRGALADDMLPMLPDDIQTILNAFDTGVETPSTWLHWLARAFSPGGALLPPSSEWPAFKGRGFGDFTSLRQWIDDPATDGEPLSDQHVALWERFVSDVRDPETIRDLVLRQWWSAIDDSVVFKNPKEPVPPDPAETEMQNWEIFFRRMRRHLTQRVNPFRQMARGVIARDDYWRLILKTQDTTSAGNQVRKELWNQFQKYALTDVPARLTNLPALAPEVVASLKAVIDREAMRIAPSAPNEQLRPRERPQGVTLEFDQPCHADEMQQTDDLLSRIAGVVVLTRHPTDAAAAARLWRCLSYAQLKLVPDGVTKPDDITAIDPLACLYLAPNRPGYSNAKRETTLTYDNHPLVAESPAAALFVQSAADFPAGFEEGDSGHGRVHHVPVPAASALMAEARLVGLAYGRELAFAAFPVLNTGILHPRLSAGHPALPRAITSVDTATAFGCEIDVPYRRLVGVSEPRMLKKEFDGGIVEIKAMPGIEQTIVENNPFVPPEIPRSVRPLAWEITGEDKQDFADTSEVLRRPSLILLSKKCTPVSMHLRKPTTGLENWSRWHAGDPKMNQRRADEIALDAKQAENSLQSTPDPQQDISLDDPALENFLLIEAECLFSLQQPLPVVTSSTTTPWPVGGGSQPDKERRGSSSFAFEINATTGLTSDKLSMPEGSVWRVRFHPLVSEDDFKKFEPAAFRTAEEAAKKGEPGDWQISDPDRVIGGKHYVVFRPWEILVEAATTKMPEADDIWKRLEAISSGDAVELALVGDGTHYFVEVDPTTKEKKERGDALFAFVSRVEVRHQVWNWTGWQTKQFPFTQQTPFEDEKGKVFEWEATGFHDRAPWQYANNETTISWRNERKTRRLATLFTQNHAGDPRALYYRFTAVARSRYEGLDGNDYAKQVAASRQLTGDVPDLWRRCLLHPRPLERLPRPSVNIILPLTRKYDPENLAHPKLATNMTAGLLIVLRDRWYANAGLAEAMEMEIGVHQHWTKPNGGNWSSLDYWAAGFDPIVATKALSGGKTALRQEFKDGPVGHTFDIGASSPLLAASSFVLDSLPASIMAEVPDLSWIMAQIRLRRVHAPGSLSGSDGTGTVDETWASEWTAPEWVQFLPDANRMLPETWLESGAVAMKPGAGAGQVDVAEWKEPDRGDNADSRLFDHWLLVTRPVVDVRGQQQEQYVGILGRTGADNGTIFSIIDGALPSAPSKSNAPFFVRVMELRLARMHLDVAVVREKFRETIANTPANPAPQARHRLDCIFGFKEDKAHVLEDARAQITALSDRLDVQFTNPA